MTNRPSQQEAALAIPLGRQQQQRHTSTPVPSDWEHAKILIGRSFRKDRQKPKLYFAKFILLPILLMLYCIGFLFSAGGLAEEPAMIAGGFELFEGTPWKYPQTIRVAGWDDDITAMVGQNMNDQFILEGVEDAVNVEWSSTSTSTDNTTAMNRTEFVDDCQATIDASTASEEVCVYLDAMDNYTIYYGGKEDASPFQSALAGAQWTVNSALLAIHNNTNDDHGGGGGTSTNTNTTPIYYYPVSQIQQVPQKVSESDYEPILIVLLLPPVMQVLACAVATQFMVGPITYEKVNHVTESFLFVGVKMRTYLFQWIAYYSINLIITAIILTVVSIYWNLMP